MYPNNEDSQRFDCEETKEDANLQGNGQIQLEIKNEPFSIDGADVISIIMDNAERQYSMKFQEFSQAKDIWGKKECIGWMEVGERCATLKESNQNGERIDLTWKEDLGKGSFGKVRSIKFSRGNLFCFYAGKYATTPIGFLELRDEWEYLRQLTHDHIVQYIGFIEFPKDHCFPELVLIMERCLGEDLKRVINDTKRSYSIGTVVYWGEHLFSALDYLQEQNLIHRDIKPSNILLVSKDTRPEQNSTKISYDVKLCDFGSVMRSENTTRFAVLERYLKGTPRYMSPEAYDELICHRSDIYCLGLVLWELIERKICYTASSEWRLKIEKQRAPPLVQKACPEALRQIVFDCTRPSYEHRAENAKKVQERLTELLKDHQESERSSLGLIEIDNDLTAPSQPAVILSFEDIFKLMEIESTNDSNCMNDGSAFYRKEFKLKFANELVLGNFDQKVSHEKQAELYSRRYRQIKSDIQEIKYTQSTTIEDGFLKILLADFEYQVNLFETVFELLLDSAKVVAVNHTLASDHLEYGCWDLFHGLDKSLIYLQDFEKVYWSIDYEFDCFDLQIGANTVECRLLKKDFDGGLFLCGNEMTEKKLYYLNGTWEEKEGSSFCQKGCRVFTVSERQSKLTCTDVIKMLRAEITKLKILASLYSENLDEDFKFQISDYVFQLRNPPNHSRDCEEKEEEEGVGFPKEIDWADRIGRCKCVQYCQSFIEVYTMVCKLFFSVRRKGVAVLKDDYLKEKLKIQFQDIANVEHQEWQFYFHEDCNEELLILDHPANYQEIHSLDKRFLFAMKDFTNCKFSNGSKKITIHEIFNVNHYSIENEFFKTEIILIQIFLSNAHGSEWEEGWRLCYTVLLEGSLQIQKQRAPPLVGKTCPEGLRQIVFDCTRPLYEHRAENAKTVQGRLTEILKHYQGSENNSLGLIEIDDQPSRPVDFDLANEKRNVQPAATVSFENTSELMEIESTNNSNCMNYRSSAFDRKVFEELKKELEPENFDEKVIYQNQAKIYSSRYRQIENDYKTKTQIQSTTMEDRFQKILLTDFAHQANVFETIFEVLIDSTKVISYPSASDHLEYGCWDLLHGLHKNLIDLQDLEKVNWSIDYEFDCYDLQIGVNTVECRLLKKGLDGGLFLCGNEMIKKELHYLNGTWEEKGEGPSFRPNGCGVFTVSERQSSVTCTDMLKMLRAEISKLKILASFYSENFDEDFRFQISDYVFQLRNPPNHSWDCKEEELIKGVGFPKEIDWIDRIGRCKCVQCVYCEKVCPHECKEACTHELQESCHYAYDEKHVRKSFLEVYTMICKLFFSVRRKGASVLKDDYLKEKLKIHFQDIANVEHQEWQFYFHKELLILDNPANYQEIHSVDKKYLFAMKDFTKCKFSNGSKKIGIHEIFNVNCRCIKNKFFESC